MHDSLKIINLINPKHPQHACFIFATFDGVDEIMQIHIFRQEKCKIKFCLYYIILYYFLQKKKNVILIENKKNRSKAWALRDTFCCWD